MRVRRETDRPKRCVACHQEATHVEHETQYGVVLRGGGRRTTARTVETYWCDQHSGIEGQ